MLKLNPEERINASEALLHPCFSSDPLPCEPKDLKLLDGDSHEFLIQIQQDNKTLTLLKNNESPPLKLENQKKEIIKAKKRHLLVTQNGSTMAPSTKSFIG